MSGANDVGRRTIYTIGHSSHPVERFVALLAGVGVHAVVDVRSMPYSRRHPQFNLQDLGRTLRAHGIRYGAWDAALGARSDDAKCYVNGRVSYGRLAETALFRAALERVRSGSRSNTIALMCAEADPIECHRTILIGRELAERGENVAHILRDGRIEKHDDTIKRLIGRLGLKQQDIFGEPVALVRDAYAMQEERIAYAPGERWVREVEP